jgi:hypothetical protein
MPWGWCVAYQSLSYSSRLRALDRGNWHTINVLIVHAVLASLLDRTQLVMVCPAGTSTAPLGFSVASLGGLIPTQLRHLSASE